MYSVTSMGPVFSKAKQAAEGRQEKNDKLLENLKAFFDATLWSSFFLTGTFYFVFDSMLVLAFMSGTMVAFLVSCAIVRRAFLSPFESNLKTLSSEEQAARLVAERLIHHQRDTGISLIEWSRVQIDDCLVTLAIKLLEEQEANPTGDHWAKDQMVTLYEAARRVKVVSGPCDTSKYFAEAKRRLAEVAERKQAQQEARATD